VSPDKKISRLKEMLLQSHYRPSNEGKIGKLVSDYDVRELEEYLVFN
jgi:hypothetical protein